MSEVNDILVSGAGAGGRPIPELIVTVLTRLRVGVMVDLGVRVWITLS